MKISELFYSIQGEGKRTGFPSFFIRANYCNLRCKFSGGNLCDTAYTSWYFDDKSNIGEMKISAILDEYKKYNCKDIVITGGEPVIQAKELTHLCKSIKELNPDCFITIETNGTFVDDYVIYAGLMSISPKLKTSIPYKTEYENMHSTNRLNFESLIKYQEYFENSTIDIQWKFVVNDEKDLDEIFGIQKIVGFKNENIFLMPEGITPEEINSKRPFIVELCKKHKVNYTDRLHVLLWGNERGK